MKTTRKYVMAYKRLPGHNQKPELYELEFDRYKQAPHNYKVVSGIPFDKPLKSSDVVVPVIEEVKMPEVVVMDLEAALPSELTEQEEFDLLSAKGWSKLKGDERARYKELKSICG